MQFFKDEKFGYYDTSNEKTFCLIIGRKQRKEENQSHWQYKTPPH
jgi:hypothetical protein